MFSMLNCMPLDPTVYTYRTYVVSSGDSFSARKAVEFEEGLKGNTREDNTDGEKRDEASSLHSDSYIIITIPRARRVHQSFLTAPFSTLQCFWACLQVLCGAHPDQRSLKRSMASTYPDLILTNGPATAVCVILAAKLLRLLDYTMPWLSRSIQGPGGQSVDAQSKEPSPARLRTIFVESWARVTTLSLSGKILLPVADRFLVQWPALAGRRAWKGMRETEYVGALVY
ncbi:UDP-N-acetylglucosamine transferase subunit [Paecilomyces lecythidis]|uniref:UDP-N-acetylglucosamine transferase subunit ALG14 n=1 Tax=Paecilomyces lecythidis TaxID=3004212 RepID=A0ABR3YE66_9EURO